MEQEEYRNLMIASRPMFWGSFKVNHADWLDEGETCWTFGEWAISTSLAMKGELVHGNVTHVEITVEGAGEDRDGLYMGEVIDFDPYRGEFYVEFS